MFGKGFKQRSQLHLSRLSLHLFPVGPWFVGMKCQKAQKMDQVITEVVKLPKCNTSKRCKVGSPLFGHAAPFVPWIALQQQFFDQVQGRVQRNIQRLSSRLMHRHEGMYLVCKAPNKAPNKAPSCSTKHIVKPGRCQHAANALQAVHVKNQACVKSKVFCPSYCVH